MPLSKQKNDVIVLDSDSDVEMVNNVTRTRSSSVQSLTESRASLNYGGYAAAARSHLPTPPESPVLSRGCRPSSLTSDLGHLPTPLTSPLDTADDSDAMDVDGDTALVLALEPMITLRPQPLVLEGREQVLAWRSEWGKQLAEDCVDWQEYKVDGHGKAPFKCLVCEAAGRNSNELIVRELVKQDRLVSKAMRDRHRNAAPHKKFVQSLRGSLVQMRLDPTRTKSPASTKNKKVVQPQPRPETEDPPPKRRKITQPAAVAKDGDPVAVAKVDYVQINADFEAAIKNENARAKMAENAASALRTMILFKYPGAAGIV